MSQEYLSAVVAILAVLLPKFGVEIGSEALTTTLSTIITVISALWIMFRRYQRGDINVLGGRK